jgi:hypothetical protein
LAFGNIVGPCGACPYDGGLVTIIAMVRLNVKDFIAALHEAAGLELAKVVCGGAIVGHGAAA